jgi:succinate dehydrogenase / fumarate reductase membrane anchor subunit
MENRSADHLRSYSRGKKSGAPSWMMVRITGLLLVILTVGHYVMMHYNPASGHDYDWTSARLSSPIFKGMYLAFITIGMYHGLLGIWNIVRDFKFRKWLTYTIFGAILIAGIVFIGIGWNTMLTFDPNKP